MKWIFLVPLSTLAVLVVVLFLIMLLRIGVRLSVCQEKVDIWIRAACFSIHVYPRSQKEKRNKKAAHSTLPPVQKTLHFETCRQASDNTAVPDTASAEPKTSFPSVQALCAYARFAVESAGRLIRGLRIDKLWLRADIASSDASKTALAYGSACAAVSSIWPLLDRTFQIRSQNISINACFEANKPELEVDLIITALVGRLVFIGLRIWQKYSKLKKAVQKNEQPG